MDSTIGIAVLSTLMGALAAGAGLYLLFFRGAMAKDDHEVLCSRTQSHVSSQLQNMSVRIDELKDGQSKISDSIGAIMLKLTALDRGGG